jgi:hypothetical protein
VEDTSISMGIMSPERVLTKIDLKLQCVMTQVKQNETPHLDYEINMNIEKSQPKMDSIATNGKKLKINICFENVPIRMRGQNIHILDHSGVVN